MNARRTLELIEKYGTCADCGNENVGNGEGKLEVTEDSFTRSCKCGWSVRVAVSRWTGGKIDWERVIPIIERAFGFSLHACQIHFLKTGEYTARGRATGKTTAYCIKLALEHREPIRLKDIGKHRDEDHGIAYPSWFRHRFMEVWDKLREAGFPVVEIIRDDGACL